MIKVKRANVVLKINDVEKQHYLDKGYSVLDENGNVVEQAVPKNVAELEVAFEAHAKKIAELEALVEKLEAENKVLSEMVKVAEEADVKEESASEEPKKRGPKKKESKPE